MACDLVEQTGGVNQAGISVKDYALNRGDLTDAATTERNSKPRSKACRENSAEVIVPAKDSGREGLNPTEVNNRQKTIE